MYKVNKLSIPNHALQIFKMEENLMEETINIDDIYFENNETDSNLSLAEYLEMNSTYLLNYTTYINN